MQTNVPTLVIREALVTACSDCLLHGQDHLGQAFTVVTLNAQHDPLPSLLRGLDAQGPVYCIDLHGVDLITPSFARSLIVEVSRLNAQAQAPAVLIGVEGEVLQGLRDMHVFLRKEFAVWAMDERARSHLVGVLPDRLQVIVDLVQAQG